jgi:uncharacterized repeat protein (TIGR02543 family)
MAFGSVQTKTGSWVTGSGYNAYRAVLYYAVNSETTKVTFNSQLAVQSGEGHDSLSNFTLKLNGATKTSRAYLNSGATVKVASDNGIVVTRNKTTQYKTLSSYATGGSWSGSSEAKVTITVDPLPSYAVTFNANGGTGAPTSQTKWYGETLSLSGWGTTSGTKAPTRANYNFLGWSTSSTATSATYTSSSHSYTGNAPLTLYAVWELAFVAPTISSFSAYRSDSSGNSDPSSTGYLTFKCVWSFNQTGGTNNSGSVKFTYGSTSTTVTISGATSGTATKTVSGTFTDAYSVTALLTDKNGLTATKSTRVPTIWRPFTMRKTGTNAASAAFFGLADTVAQNLLKIFGRLDIEGQVASYVQGAQGNAGLRFYKRELGVDQWNPAILLQTKSGGNWTIGNYNGEELRVVYFTKANIDSGNNNTVLNMAFGTDVYSWHQAISTWRQLASAKSGTAMTFTLPTNCTEVMVAAVCTTTSSNVRVYAGSVVIPRVLLSTTTTEWLLGGGSANGGSSTSGIRYAAVDITTTKATGIGVYSDGTNHASTTTFYVYAR